jgi:fibronectin-binding autotransporter adhesin
MTMRVLFTTMLMCFLTQAVFAESALWQGNVSGVWDTSALNWTRGGVPSRAYQDGDDTIFDNSAAIFTVTSTGTNAPASVLVTNTTTYAISAAIGGAGALTKAGSGVVTLSGTNAYSGGTVISGGTLRVSADHNLGSAGTAITFDGTGMLENDKGSMIDLGARPIVLNENAVGTLRTGRSEGFTTTGAITGSGTLTISDWGNSYQYINLLSPNHTFTGPLHISGGNVFVSLASLVDSTNAISLIGRCQLTYSGTGALTLDNRTIVLSGSATLKNASANPMTVNTDVTISGTGNKSLALSGTGVLNGSIDEDAATLAVSSHNSWSLAGSNRWNGATTIESGTLAFLGPDAMPTNSKVVLKRSTVFSIRTDEAGSVNLGNAFGVAPIDTSSGVISQHSIDVRNNGGGTTGSTIVLGTVDLSTGDMRANRQINVRGGNGYILQVGDVRMSPNLRGTATGGPNRFNPSSASMIIAGTVKQVDGDTGSSTTDNTLYLGGTMSGNAVSGIIADADDYTSGSNANANALNVYKGDTGEWTLTGINTYSGTTTINGGLLQVDGSITSTNVIVSSGGALGGTGTVADAVSLTGSGGIDLRDGIVASLTLGSDLNINGAVDANDLAFDLGTSSNGTDSITVAGDVTMATPSAGLITLNQLSGTKIDAGAYDLIVASGAMPAATNFSLATTAAFGNTFSLQLDGTSQKLQVVVAGAPVAPANAYWTGNSSTDWSTPGNWSSDITGHASLSQAPGHNTHVRMHANGAAQLTTGVLAEDFDIDRLTYTAGAIANTKIGGTSKTLILEAASGTGITVNTSTTNSPVHTIEANVALATSQTWTSATNAALTVAGVVSDFGAGHSLTKAGDGDIMLSGLNTYSGATIVETGTLQIWHYSLGNSTVPNALGMSSVDPANLVLNPGTTLEFLVTGDSVRSTDRGFTINGTADGDSATLKSEKASGSAYDGVSLTSSASPGYGTPNQTRTLILRGTQASGGGNYNSNTRLYAAIADNGSGAVSLIKQDVGSWQLYGTCSYSGGTTVSGGALRTGKVNALPSTGAVILADASGAALVLDNFSQIIGSLSGGGTNGGNVSLGSGTLTVGDASSTTYAGKISGTGGLTKQGNGSLTLAATNTYTGTTTIIGGTLRLREDSALGSGDVVLDGGILDMGGFSNQVDTLTVTSASTIRTGAGSLSFADSSGIVWTGELTVVGPLSPRRLRFGTDDTALTEAQLESINNDGFRVTLSEEGYLRSQGGSLFIVR